MSPSRPAGPGLPGAVDRYVTPGQRYLKLLHGNFARKEENERGSFLRALAEAAREVTDDELEVLLASEWRARLTAAWLIGTDRRAHFRDLLADLLLASQTGFSGQGYCFALARFGTGEDARYLAGYLDRWLRRPECEYDQPWALSALLHLDSRTGSRYAARFLGPGGLWEQWSGRHPQPVLPDRRVTELCALVDQYPSRRRHG